MSDIVARLRDWRSLHLARLGGLFDEAADAVESLRREVREQRRELAGLREERRAMLEADRPQVDDLYTCQCCGAIAYASGLSGGVCLHCHAGRPQS